MLLVLSACQKPDQVIQPVEFVNPFIGTNAHGHTFPGATMPFGMVQLSPQTRLTGWDGCSGYHYSDSVIYGFAHTALSGTGASDYGDILIMPLIGEPVFSNTQYASSFRKENEAACAGYYSVFLDKPGVKAELTATTRAGYHRYTFPASNLSKFIIDLSHRDKVLDSWIEVVSDTEIRGMRRSTKWAKDMRVYFYIQFSKPFAWYGIAINNELTGNQTIANGTNLKAFLGFETASNEVIEIKVGISAVDEVGAKNNLSAEIPGWNFDEIRQQASDAWNKKLKVIEVKGGNSEQLTTFYTALYHVFLQPNTYFDVDRRYRGMDQNIHEATDFDNYTVFSIWDTYRTWHPLMTILDPALANNFVKVFLDMYEKGGLLPVWELAANETFCMIGYHSVSVIVDAWMKGLRDFDPNQALEAMIHSANQNHFGLKSYRQYGYIAGDKEHEAVSKTLEYCYDDWCIAQFAKDIGRQDVYDEFLKRAQYYKNIFDPSTGFMRPKLNGNWLTPFNPTKVDWNFTEANSWQYSFYVPQDVSGLIGMHGGKQNLERLLDELFETSDTMSGRHQSDITGLIGMYAHGNEPSHHMAYLYNFVNKPWKTQMRVRQIMDNLYSHQPDGYCGNEDCGQMSAWLVMSAMGFYPVTPGNPEYIIGTPWFPEMIINLDDGNSFKINAKDVSKRNFYVQSVKLNGQKFASSFISHKDIMSGGKLEFVMGSKPNHKWASTDENVPETAIRDHLILTVPVINAADQRFKDSMEISISHPAKQVPIFYTTDGSAPDKNSPLYVTPFMIHASATIKAIAWDEELGFSFPVEANFYKIDLDRTVTVAYPPRPNYTAGGINAIIDGLRGAENWRLGHWQGYQGVDFEAVVDLGSKKSIKKISAGFVQDVQSWILMPVKVEYFISENGKTFHRVAEIKNIHAADDYHISIRDFEAKINANARYVKVLAHKFGKLPAWHLGAGGDAYIFVDEITIE